jgi:hydroxymethylbilane synthase
MPNTPPRRLIIATRESALALWQAEHIRARLAAEFRHVNVEILGMTTRGDQVLDRPLAEVGGKGLFIKELEVAMADGRADLAVHSLKDVPMDMPDGFVLAAITAREDPRDAFVSNRFGALAELAEGAVVGTSSRRREVQLHERFPHLTIKSLRGNVNTRLAKLDAGLYDGIVLAAAGLKRLGLAERIRELVDVRHSLPAAGQGALAIECRTDRPDLIAALAQLGDTASYLATSAERGFARSLFGDCQTPMGAYAEWLGDSLWLRGLVASEDGKEIMRGENAKDVVDAEGARALGEALANDFLARGAAHLVSP